jgi:DNA polymerase-3 subunit gamma/tau
VYILDEAHMVTAQGFNALLKLVEEPPEFVVFIFATTEPDKVLQTIRSRTHHYPFRLVPPSVLRAHLERIIGAEGVTAEPAVLPLVVRAGGGSVRDSLSILDQLLAGADERGLTYASAVALLGVTDGTLLDDIVDALAAGDAAGVYGTVDRVVEAGHDPRRFAADLLERFRDLIVLDAVPDADERGLLDAPSDTLAHMAEQATRIGSATLTRYAEIVHAALIEMRGTTSPRLVLELLCARMQLPDAAADSAALLQRIERLERRQTISQAEAPGSHAPALHAEPLAAGPYAEARMAEPAKPPKAPPAAPSGPRSTPLAEPKMAEPEIEPDAAGPGPSHPADAPTVSSEPGKGADAADGVLDATALRRIWPEVLEAVKRTSRRTRALLDGAQVHDLDGDLVTLSIAAAPLARMLGEDSNTEVIKSALNQTVGGAWRLTVIVAGAAAVSSAPAESPPPPPEPAAPPSPKIEIPPPPVPRPAHERANGEANLKPPGAETDPREDSEPEPDGDDGVRLDPEAEALRLLESTLGARPIND